jgi:hypothetical protein
MKFTQEDLLNAMGLKVGDRVLISCMPPAEIERDQYGDPSLLWVDGKMSELCDLINIEYTVIPQPKYTLTETEKHIVLAIDEKWKWIARDREGLHIYTALPKFDYDYQDFGCTDGYTEYLNVFIDKFGFVIENREPVSLDELREIAKK